MAADTRDRMVQSAAALFRDRGYDGTGFRDVVEAAGTTPGVIYHHFPGGKTELGVIVAQTAGGRLVELVQAVCAEQSPREAVVGLLDVIERHLIKGDLRPGCPIVAVSLAADDEDGRLRAAGDGIFMRIRAAIVDCLKRDGVPMADAEHFATLAVSASEGAVILCRAHRDTTPLRDVRSALVDQVDRLPRTAR
jgi:TetR/AcrR family transcriptional repressor of lmrAB and yxaGH operons